MGCDRIGCSCIVISSGFNPRTHMGCDHKQKIYFSIDEVSIHAPTWGATPKISFRQRHLYPFQSTHPHGVRRAHRLGYAYIGLFQSTHPHGVRRWLASYNLSLAMFQSTHPHGVRQRGMPLVLRCCLFQSTHPHGVRRRTGRIQHLPCWFQSTHPHGVRLSQQQSQSLLIMVSIHAPTWGATYNLSEYCGCKEFQSTHPHGVRHMSSASYCASSSFNPRTHMGCDSDFSKGFSRFELFQSTHPHGVRHMGSNA